MCSVQFSPSSPHLLAAATANCRAYLYDLRKTGCPLSTTIHGELCTSRQLWGRCRGEGWRAWRTCFGRLFFMPSVNQVVWMSSESLPWHRLCACACAAERFQLSSIELVDVSLLMCRSLEGCLLRALPVWLPARHCLHRQLPQAVGHWGIRCCDVTKKSPISRVYFWNPIILFFVLLSSRKQCHLEVAKHGPTHTRCKHARIDCAGESSQPTCTMTYAGHVNERNFVGLSASQDGYLACGSETNEVYCYFKVGFACSSLPRNTRLASRAHCL